MLHSELRFAREQYVFPPGHSGLAQLHLDAADAIRTGVAEGLAVDQGGRSSSSSGSISSTISNSSSESGSAGDGGGSHPSHDEPAKHDAIESDVWAWRTSADPAVVEAAQERGAEHDRAYFAFERLRMFQLSF